MLFNKPDRKDPETGKQIPSWWRDEEDATASAKQFMSMIPKAQSIGR